MKLIKKLLLAILLCAFIFVSIVSLCGYSQYKQAINRMPLETKIEAIKKQDNYVCYEELSPYLLQATVAIEDHRFYDHNGFDVLATGRAFLATLLGYGRSGGSTITQQLAKNLYFGYEPSLTRKVSELFVAHDIEASYSKEEILTIYMNIINYGDNHIGIKEAAQGYFHMDAKDLDLAQASLLAGLPQSPANYQLSDHYEQAKKRQKQVLQAMQKQHMISEQEMKDAFEKKLIIYP